MGFHICEYCQATKNYSNNRFDFTSSGDVTLQFDNDHIWIMPDMILHYVADHHWLPPAEFIDDVMKHTVTSSERAQTKGLPTLIGYLTGSFTTGDVPTGFVEILAKLMDEAEKSGSRRQTRSI